MESGIALCCGGTTFRVTAAVAEVAAFVARIVKVKLPAAVGVPESMPPEESVSPAGNEPDATLQVIGGVPEAEKVYE